MRRTETHKPRLPNLVVLLLLLSVVGCTTTRQERLLEEADQRAGNGDYRKAVALYQRVVTLAPDSTLAIRALYKLGFVQETYLRDYESSVLHYGEFLKRTKDPVRAYEVQKRIANIFFEHHRDPEKAIVAYRRLMEMNPESLELDAFQLRIALSQFRKSDFAQARIEFQSLVERFPKSPFVPRARFEIGNCYYMEGRYDLAIEALKQVLRHHPQSDYAVEAQFLIGQSQEHQGQLRAALQSYEAVKGRYPAGDVVDLRIQDVSKRLKQEKG
jgi:TolA-binding protein